MASCRPVRTKIPAVAAGQEPWAEQENPLREETLPSMSGKRAFLELLKQEGVEILFGNPGTTELPLMDALAVDNDLRYVLGLQEAAVMAMADGYAQASGRLSVVNQIGRAHVWTQATNPHLVCRLLHSKKN